MMRPTKAGTMLTAVLILSACATMSDAPVKYADGVMINEAGMTVYTFDKDPAGKSVCNDKCAMNWPPLRASADSDAGGDFSVITRNDGNDSGRTKGNRSISGSRIANQATRPAMALTTSGTS